MDLPIQPPQVEREPTMLRTPSLPTSPGRTCHKGKDAVFHRPVAVLTACAFAIIATAPAARCEDATSPERPPNIVFIMADDLGYCELGCYGQKRIRTPTIDRLAAEGMRFTQHYAGNAVCAPSRCVLMTGKHPGHASIRNNREIKPEGQQPIPAGEVTIAELLGDLGYVCGAFGKWGLGGPGSSGDPLRQGFDRFFGYNCQRHAHSYYPSYLWDDDRRIKLDNCPPVPGHAALGENDDPNDPASFAPFKGEDYASDRINAAALEFIRANKDRPFFLYYPTIIPHLALHVPDEELEPYRQLGWGETPFTGRQPGSGYTPHQTPRAAYAAMITRMDRYVGRVLELLADLGLAENTIVVFTSDNGTTFLQREVDYKFFESVGPLRGLKGSLFEGGVRVPMIARFPGRVEAGTTCDRVTGFEDWLPTLLELIGHAGAMPQQIDGISFAPTLLGDDQPARPFLYREFPGGGGQQAVWLGRYKGIRREMLRRANRNPLHIELYDLAADPGEEHDIARKHPDIVAEIAKIMRREHIPSKLFPLGPADKRE